LNPLSLEEIDEILVSNDRMLLLSIQFRANKIVYEFDITHNQLDGHSKLIEKCRKMICKFDRKRKNEKS
jgi:hypothetical protein